MTILNRNNKKLALLIDMANPQKGLAFVAHGLGGNKDQSHIKIFADELNKRGYTVVRFDAANTFGESEGEYSRATVTNYKEDLEDVITWAAGQEWYQEPFLMVGTRLGGITTLLYAEDHPEKVAALGLKAPVISGQLSHEYKLRMAPDELSSWKSTGWKVEPSVSRPGTVKRLPWSHMEDRLKYDVLPNATRLTMPVCIIVGSMDTSCPVEHQQLLVERLPGRKELCIIEGMPHTPREEEHLRILREKFGGWLDTLV